MKIHFSNYERAAGIFVMVAFVAFIFFTLLVAQKQGWFRPRHHYTTLFEQGEGLHPGTLIQISGLRAGAVDSVSLDDDNRIEVKMTITHEFQKRIRSDSVARVIRPFIIGDKVVEITMGSKEVAMLEEGMLIKSEETLDLMDMLGAGKLGPYLHTIDGLLKNLQVVVEAFSDPKRSHALIGMFDELLPTMVDIREVSHEMTSHKNLGTSMQNLSGLTTQMNVMLPQMIEFSKHLPELGESSAKTMEQLRMLTIEMNKILPAISAVAPQLPEASQKSIEALKQAVIVLRAMQKSFLLKGAVKDVQEEDAKLEEKSKIEEKTKIEEKAKIEADTKRKTEQENRTRQPAETK